MVDASRHINLFVTKRKVKLDLLEDFAFMIKEGDFVAVDNLDSGYCLYFHLKFLCLEFQSITKLERKPSSTNGRCCS